MIVQRTITIDRTTKPKTTTGIVIIKVLPLRVIDKKQIALFPHQQRFMGRKGERTERKD